MRTLELKLSPLLIALVTACVVWCPSTFAATCVAPTPSATARWLHDHDTKIDPPEKIIRAALSNELYRLLQKEHACIEKTQEVCAIDADLWTNAQDGGIYGTASFADAATTPVKATVEMKYKFALYENGHDAIDKMTTIYLVRKSASACWTVDDIVGPEGWSLKKALLTNK